MEIFDIRNFKDPVNIKVTCHICGKSYLITVERSDYELYASGKGHIQDIFPYLSPSDRELLISQTCRECWDEMFKYFD